MRALRILGVVNLTSPHSLNQLVVGGKWGCSLLQIFRYSAFLRRVPWRIVLARELSWRVTCPYHESFLLLITQSNGSCAPAKSAIRSEQTHLFGAQSSGCVEAVCKISFQTLLFSLMLLQTRSSFRVHTIEWLPQGSCRPIDGSLLGNWLSCFSRPYLAWTSLMLPGKRMLISLSERPSLVIVEPRYLINLF